MIQRRFLIDFYVVLFVFWQKMCTFASEKYVLGILLLHD